MRHQPKTHITPGKTTLYLGEVAELFGLKPNTIRQNIRRGTMPQPTVRRDPELGWHALDIYRWAYKSGRLPLDAIPFRYLRDLIIDGTLPGPQAPRLFEVTTRTGGDPFSGPGIHVRYGGLTDASLGFTLYYPDGYGRIEMDPQQVGVVVEVTGHYSIRGWYVDVHQTHPEYEYAPDTEFYTQDVALLVQEPLPYWPRALRSVSGGVDRRTGHIIPVKGATAVSSSELVARGLAVEAFADDPRHAGQHDLLAALRADVAHDYRVAATETQEFLDEYLTPHQADAWTLSEPSRHLHVAATPAMPEGESVEEEFARTRLPELLWETAVGDTAAARQVAKEFVRTRDQYQFSIDEETEAQRHFRTRLIRVPADKATLVHLAFAHPRYDRSPGGAAVPREYWRDAVSGALVTLFRAVDDAPAYARYSMPTEYPNGIEVAAFDFDAEHQPFVWTSQGGAVPFPLDPQSGYSLGYSGAGPQAIKAMAARLLGLDRRTSVGPRWPFYREGYPTRVSADEMKGFYA